MVTNKLQTAPRFADRSAAGRALAPEVAAWQLTDPLILALPRGGVSVARALAQELRIPWDILLVAKIASAENRELALGAVSEYGPALFDQLRIAGLSSAEQQEAEHSARQRLDTQRLLFRGNQDPPAVKGRAVIIVDDGLATGWTVRAALQALSAAGAAAVYGAFPAGPPSTVAALKSEFAALLCLEQPNDFQYLSQCYQRFFSVSDKAVIQALDTRGRLHPEAGAEEGR